MWRVRTKEEGTYIYSELDYTRVSYELMGYALGQKGATRAE